MHRIHEPYSSRATHGAKSLGVAKKLEHLTCCLMRLEEAHEAGVHLDQGVIAEDELLQAGGVFRVFHDAAVVLQRRRRRQRCDHELFITKHTTNKPSSPISRLLENEERIRSQMEQSAWS